MEYSSINWDFHLLLHFIFEKYLRHQIVSPFDNFLKGCRPLCGVSNCSGISRALQMRCSTFNYSGKICPPVLQLMITYKDFLQLRAVKNFCSWTSKLQH
ncbi:hypothetical protein GDO81_020340 [Engystomops pustulosus]|uniref:Uncharacterized protein n=1 Tax=Engystomops pustulosus TaxID=76066 RepID=A0AAV6YXS3_ENGPU|nr:hypothetical protein GDO81_020340 [Engystomops pustulosus]